MSVIVEDEEGCIWLFCKGAESSVIPLCNSGPINETLKHVSEFAIVSFYLIKMYRAGSREIICKLQAVNINIDDGRNQFQNFSILLEIIVK